MMLAILLSRVTRYEEKLQALSLFYEKSPQEVS